jgi:hypothetical protein
VTGDGTTTTQGSGGSTRTEASKSGTTKITATMPTVQIDVRGGTYSIRVDAPTVLFGPEIKTRLDITETQSNGGSKHKMQWTSGSVVEGVSTGDSAEVESNGTYLAVFDRKLPDKVGELSGSVDLPLKGPGALTGHLKWTLSPAPPPPIELEMEAEGDGASTWELWRPRGTPDEAVPGSWVKLKARVISRGGALTDKPHLIKIMLGQVSQEPGVCINYPENPSATLPPADLRFRLEDNPDLLWNERSVWTLDPKSGELTATLACFDYGAWGEATATAILQSGRVLTGHVKNIPRETVLRIPHRTATSKIATAWNSPGPDDEDSDDQPPGDGQKGDGLTNYEEYRGFMVGGTWKEGDPKTKDFFVRNEVPFIAAGGVDLFEKLSKLRVHRLDVGEIRASDRLINFNHKDAPHKTDQHGVRLFLDALMIGYCEAKTRTGAAGTPKDLVDGVHITMHANPVVPVATATGIAAGMYMDSNVAHELFHCCNVWHHGDRPYENVLPMWTRNAAGEVYEGSQKISVYDEAGMRIDSLLTVGTSLLVPLKVRTDQGRASGDVRCVMRYEDSDAYRFAATPGDRVRLGAKQISPAGFSLCTAASKAAGAQVGPLGDADVAHKRGNCTDQILVNDGVPAPRRP